MKVTATVTLNVDPAAWTTKYGVTGDAGIREDVKLMVAGETMELLDGMGLLLNRTVIVENGGED